MQNIRWHPPLFALTPAGPRHARGEQREKRKKKGASPARKSRVLLALAHDQQRGKEKVGACRHYVQRDKGGG